jgi:DNA polymerase-3 subunit gamma/tau
MDAIHTALDSGTDPRVLARQVVDYLRALLLLQMGNASQVDLAADTRSRAEKHARAFSPGDVLRMVKSFNAAATDLRGGWQPSLPLEMALAEMMEFPATAATIETRPAVKAQTETKVEKPINKPGKEAEKLATPDTGITLGQVTKAWKQVSGATKANQSLAALLNSCRLLDLKNNTLTIGFASEILRAKADSPEQLEAISKAIEEVLQVKLAVKCVVSNAKQSTPVDVKADGMVAAALKAGGEIVDIQE